MNEKDTIQIANIILDEERRLGGNLKLTPEWIDRASQLVANEFPSTDKDTGDTFNPGYVLLQRTTAIRILMKERFSPKVSVDELTKKDLDVAFDIAENLPYRTTSIYDIRLYGKLCAQSGIIYGKSNVSHSMLERLVIRTIKIINQGNQSIVPEFVVEEFLNDEKVS